MAKFIYNNETILDYLRSSIDLNASVNAQQPYMIGLSIEEWAHLCNLYELNYNDCVGVLSIDHQKKRATYDSISLYCENTPSSFDYRAALQSINDELRSQMRRVSSQSNSNTVTNSRTARVPFPQYAPADVAFHLDRTDTVPRYRTLAVGDTGIRSLPMAATQQSVTEDTNPQPVGATTPRTTIGIPEEWIAATTTTTPF